MKNLLLIPILILFVLGAFSFASCDKESLVPEPDPIFIVDDQGNSSFNLNALRDSINTLPGEELSIEETDAILFMVEEEKMARDVYLVLYKKWDTQIFNNISTSEETHIQAVKMLIDKYELVDPSEGKEVGKFTNEALQTLHDSLLEKGLQSLVEGLKVGAAIEEIDILDLENSLKITDNQDVTLIFEHLQKGSRNHLRAFVKNLDRQGMTYVPQYLDVDTYETIINGVMEAGWEN